jgi:hypothetical protein
MSVMSGILLLSACEVAVLVLCAPASSLARMGSYRNLLRAMAGAPIPPRLLRAPGSRGGTATAGPSSCSPGPWTR